MPFRKEERALNAQVKGLGVATPIFGHWGYSNISIPKDIFSGIVCWWAMDLDADVVSGRMYTVQDQVTQTASFQLIQATAGNRPYVTGSDSHFGDRQVINANGANSGHTLGMRTNSLDPTVIGTFTTIIVGRVETQDSTTESALFAHTTSRSINRWTDDTIYVQTSGGLDLSAGHTYGSLAFAQKVVWQSGSSNVFMRWSDGTTYQSDPMALAYTNFQTAYLLNYVYVALPPAAGFPGAVADVILISGIPSSVEWDSFVTHWLQAKMGWT
jgi:hypothetical protein